jgi:hypothetical protein
MVQREVVDAWAGKIARFVCGDANHPDHAIDIIGYAELHIRELNKK